MGRCWKIWRDAGPVADAKAALFRCGDPMAGMESLGDTQPFALLSS